MRVAEVIGRVTLSRSHVSLRHARFLLACPLPLAALAESSSQRSEELVVYDNLGAGFGAWIGISEGREAANPFAPEKAPVDAYCACLLDSVSVEKTS
jgi:ethanolamine utilization protein EutN